MGDFSIIMVRNQKLDLYRKMKLWINELPNECINIEESNKAIYKANRDIIWFNGVICLELRIAPRAASNYAMLNLLRTILEFLKLYICRTRKIK